MWSLDGHRVLLEPTKRQLARRHRSFRLGIPRIPQMDWSPAHVVFLVMTAAIFLFAIFLATRR